MSKITDVIVRVTENYKREATEAKKDRMLQNEENYDIYHNRQDFAHKQEGQSKEFLPRQSMAVEQIVSFFEQGLVDMGKWFSIELEPGIKQSDVLLTPEEMYKLLDRQLKKAQFVSFVADSLKSGLLGSLMIGKVDGEYAAKPKFVAEISKDKSGKKSVKLNRKDNRAWQLRCSVVSQENYYPDPTGRKLYELQDIFLDMDEVFELSEGENPLYDKKAVELLSTSHAQEQEKKDLEAKQKGQNPTSNCRRQVKITECYGTVLDPVTGRALIRDAFWVIANDRHILVEPRQIQFWHGHSPFRTAPIIRVPGSVWHKALMDAASKLNISLNELFNLILDGGIMEVYGIKQVRTDWLEDESEVSNGVRPGQTLKVSSGMPVGAKVVERVDTGTISPQALAVFNLTSAELHQSSLTNEMRMGVLPDRAVKATEVVEASNTITSVFTGVAKVIEEVYIEKVLEDAWMTVCQNMDDLDSEEVKAMLGTARALELAALSPEQRFANTVSGYKFKVFGVTQTLNKIKDFRKLTALLQTISGSEVLVQAFIAKYDFGNFLEEIMRSLDINTDRLKSMQDLAPEGQGPTKQIMPVNGGPDMQSQIPQAGSQASGAIEESVNARIPRSDFPGSPATKGQ